MGYGFNDTIDGINNFLSIELFGNEIHKIILAIIVFFVVFFGLRFVMKHIHNYIKNYTKNKTENLIIVLLNIVKDFPVWFFFTLEIYIPLKILSLSSNIDMVINGIFLGVITLQLIKAVIKILIFSLSNLFKRKKIKEDKTARKTIQMMVSITVWVIGILIFLTNIGVDLTPVIASLGVASIGIAFALQSILTDLFASFSIMMSKPFVIGDFIAVGEGTKERIGTVTDITLKTTHILTAGGQEVVVPNSNILATEIINYGKMKHRRKRFKIGVAYDTSSKKLKKIPDIIKNVINKQEDVVYEWTHLVELNAYSVDFLISYDFGSPDYIASLAAQENVLIGILEALEKEDIYLAYPTQTIHVPAMDKKYMKE